jgi:tripartite-type tricarboxylate transporter receptor subunit TctC
VAAALVCQSAFAADFPAKEITVLIGYTPGSASELSLRALVNAASRYFPKPLIVLNKPGASQSIALGALAAAPPDGHTLAMTTDTYISLTSHQQKLAFDPKVLRVLLGYATLQHVLFVKSDSPYAKFEDFVAYGKTPNAAINIGGTGEGTSPDFISRVFIRNTGIRAAYIPYKGSGEYVAGVLGGSLQGGIVDLSGIKHQAEAKTVKLVMVFGDHRLPEFPDVPASREKGLGDLNLFNPVRCIVVHRATPPDRVKMLQDGFRRAAVDPAFREWAKTSGVAAEVLSARAVEDGIARTEKAGIPLLKELNLFVQ